MDDSNQVQWYRNPSIAKVTLPTCGLLGFAILVCSLSFSEANAQEPRKPSWIPFPMGRAANQFSPGNPSPGNPSPGNPSPGNPSPDAKSTDPNRPVAWLMWADPLAPNTQQPGDCYFRRTMELPEIERCFVDIDGPARTEVYFNGQRVRPAKATKGKQRIDLQQAVRPGQNILAIAVN